MKITVASQIHLRCQQIMNTASPKLSWNVFKIDHTHFCLSTSQMERIYGMQFPSPDLRGNWSLGFLKLPHTEESHPTAQCWDCSERGFGLDLCGGKRGLCRRVLKKKEKENKFFSAANFPNTSKIPIKENNVFPNCCP